MSKNNHIQIFFIILTYSKFVMIFPQINLLLQAIENVLLYYHGYLNS